ncbi:MAG: hypothetical protein JO149_00270, partial [Gammaproteobacteria bacterium]|nr:hypothetical protein [Gammaproteobacteria bacterium]
KILHYIEESKHDIVYADLAFIGLIPLIMDFRSVKCFDLFLQAYFAMIIIYPVITNHAHHFKPNQIHYDLDAVCKVVFDKQDDFFSQRFLSLMFAFYPPNHIALFKQIHYAMENGKSHLVRLAIEPLAEDKKHNLFKEWRKLDLYQYLLKKLYPVERGKNELIKACNDAAAVLQKHELNVEELVALRTGIDSRFAEYMQSMVDSEENAERVACRK